MRVLIVDDEFVSRKKAQRIMSQYGECDIATNGTETLEAFRFAHDEGKPYALIIMDILMPDMDGSEATKAIRNLECGMGKILRSKIRNRECSNGF